MLLPLPMRAIEQNANIIQNISAQNPYRAINEQIFSGKYNSNLASLNHLISPSKTWTSKSVSSSGFTPSCSTALDGSNVASAPVSINIGISDNKTPVAGLRIVT